MSVHPLRKFTFVRLPEIPPDTLIDHMSDPRMAHHMPLLTSHWDRERVDEFIATKEAYWHRDGLGHWAILADDVYVGWGGFQKEETEWDFGLVMKPAYFGLGMPITRQALAFARNDARIPFVTFLLPPTRKKLGALRRLGAGLIGEVEYEGVRFMKYRLDTT